MNKRIYQRFKTFLPVRFHNFFDKREPDAYLTNVSAQGAQLVTDQRLFMNDNLSLLVSLSDNKETLTLMGKIVRVSKIDEDLWEIGLDLENVSQEDMKNLFEEIQKKAPGSK